MLPWLEKDGPMIDWNDYNWKCVLEEVKLDADNIVATPLADEGENDGDDWIAVVKLRDGRWAFISAGCCYTGWDAMARGRIEYAHTYHYLVRWCMGEDARARLRVGVDGDPLTA